LDLDSDGGAAASEALEQSHLPAVLVADEVLHVGVVGDPRASFKPGARSRPR
jgi:hypothetical protein